MSEESLQPPEDGLSAGERRDAIVELLLERESVTVRELVERFGVSTMTAHRDLDALAERGVLRKVRGGATAQPTSLYESSLAFRLSEMKEAKERIARAAAAEVEPGSSLVLDDSTTGLAMVPFLAAIPELTIVTTFLSVVEAVAEHTEGTMNLIGIGGTYNAKYHAFGGVMAEQALRDLRVDRCFLACLVDTRRGVFHREPEQAALKRTMLEIADSCTLLADASKFSKRGMHRIAGFDSFDRAVVDDSTAAGDISGLRSQGLDVTVAGPAGAATTHAGGH
jgi:DeoR/GlpR family transcriptional regulator of sugar metabolism